MADTVNHTDVHVAAFERMAGGPPDVIFECVGTKGLIQECLSIAAARTQVVVVGVCMEPDVILPFVGMAKEITLKFGEWVNVSRSWTSDTIEVVFNNGDSPTSISMECFVDMDDADALMVGDWLSQAAAP